MKHISIIGAFLMTLATQVVGETVLYCQSELATGFIKKGDVWVQGEFKKDRFTVKFNDDFTTLEGFAYGPMDCKTNFPSVLPSQVQCSFSSGQSVVYNKQTKRFVFANISLSGFVENSGDSDTLNAGTCTKF